MIFLHEPAAPKAEKAPLALSWAILGFPRPRLSGRLAARRRRRRGFRRRQLALGLGHAADRQLDDGGILDAELLGQLADQAPAFFGQAETGGDTLGHP
jgi:hypothetical protein